MDPITRLLVFAGGVVTIVAITSIIYKRLTGKPFITFDSGRPKGGDASKPESSLNKQMSPLSGGALLGVIGFAYSLYKSQDIVHAIFVGGAVFAVLYWIMWAGQNLARRTKNKPNQAEVND